jgi:hypothetical protein
MGHPRKFMNDHLIGLIRSYLDVIAAASIKLQASALDKNL